MSEKILKVTLAARVFPQLKNTIFEEADSADLTPSKYMESILENRKSFHPTDGIDNYVSMTEYEEILTEKTELEANVAELKLQIQHLEELDSSVEENDSVEEKVALLQEQIEDLNSLLDELVIERDDFAAKAKEIQNENYQLLAAGFEDLNSEVKSNDNEDFEQGLAEEEAYRNDADGDDLEAGFPELITSKQAEEIESLNATITELKKGISKQSEQEKKATEHKEYKRLNNAINKLKTKNEDLVSDLKTVTLDRDNLLEKCNTLEKCTFHFEPTEKEEMDAYIQDLETRYPTLSINEMVLASLSCAVNNEKSSFWITTIKKYKKDKEQAENYAKFQEMLNGKSEEEEIIEDLETITIED